MPSSEPTELATIPAEERAEIEQTLGRLDRVARLMDDQFELPIIHRRIGLDPIIGLFPGGGDWATWVVSVYIFWESLRLSAPKTMLVRMVTNVTIDLVTGYVPLLGDVFDAAFKANRKNVDMLLDFYGAKKGEKRLQFPSDLPENVEREREKAGVGRYLVGLVVVLGLFLVAALPIVLLWWLLR
jgi:hypothetical protein